MTKTFCDGCGVEITLEINTDIATYCVRVERVAKSRGTGIPAGITHWCVECARTAFKAVKPSRFSFLSDRETV